MAQDEERWAVPDLDQAIAVCRQRNREGIRCTLHPLLPYAATPAQASSAPEPIISCLGAIADARVDASLSIKLATLGSGVDRTLCRKGAEHVAGEAAARGIRLEIDMEGRGLAGFTLGTAAAIAKAGHRPTLAIQAYLDRSSADLRLILASGIRPRIVKGAYLGDTGDFPAIQERFRALVLHAAESVAQFSAGTHDPDLIRWLEERFKGSRGQIEFGFLRGLADATKMRLAAGGWEVSEYVPFGRNPKAYVLRRERYLENLLANNRVPAP